MKHFFKSQLPPILLFLIFISLFSCSDSELNIPVTIHSDPYSDIVHVRISFDIGSAHDSDSLQGLAYLTAQAVLYGGSGKLFYNDIQNKNYHMAAQEGVIVDKEVTSFWFSVHKDYFSDYYKRFKMRLLYPKFSTIELNHIINETVSTISSITSPGQGESLVKDVLEHVIYKDHPYGHFTFGSIEQIERIRAKDIYNYWESFYSVHNISITMGGHISDKIKSHLTDDFNEFHYYSKKTESIIYALPDTISGIELYTIKSNDKNITMSLGLPIPLNYSDDDYYALQVFNSFLGEHRNYYGKLFQKIRQERGLNFGNYSYLQPFYEQVNTIIPENGFTRQINTFSIVMKSLAKNDAHFALRTTLYTLDKILNEGMTQEEFELTREFLKNYSFFYEESEYSKLGIISDSKYFGTNNIYEDLRTHLDTMTVENVNRVMRKYIHTNQFRIVLSGASATELGKKIKRNTLSTYGKHFKISNSVKKENKIIEDYPIEIKKRTPLNIKTIFQ